MKENKSHSTKKLYKQKDPSGDFILTREAGPSSTKDEFLVKGQLQLKTDVLEKSISISDIENKLLEPKVSQFTIWINKKKYFSEITRDKAGNQLIVRLIAPEPKNNGVKFSPLTTEATNLCFFSQVIECAQFRGFFKKGLKKNNKLSLNIIWDGYPFFHQVLENFPPKLISEATLVFEEENKTGDKLLALKIEGDEIIFELDSDNKLIKRLWVSKGVTIEKISDTL